MDKKDLPKWVCIPEEEYKKLQECKPLLREGETPLQCILRHQKNTTMALHMYAKAMKGRKSD